MLLAGDHRSGDIAPKDGMVFEGMPGAILNGSILLDEFEPTGETWTLAATALSDRRHGTCVDDYQACALRNDLFMDNTMIWRVDSRDNVGPGTWWGGEGLIVVGDDPRQRKVELSVMEHAFLSDASDVVIRDLIVEKYATTAQSGAIQAQLPDGGDRGVDWLIEDVESRLNHAIGIKAGEGTIVRRVHAHHNGQLGLAAAGGTNVVIESSEINNNNTRGFSSGWEAGGTKFTRTTGLVVRDNTVYDNLGPGLWTDIDCYDTLYEDNVSYGNAGPGIYHEISFDAVIRNNEVYSNGFGQAVWLWGAGIMISASTGVEVTGNLVYDNADGIAGVQQLRDGPHGLWLLGDLWVHHNEVTMNDGQTGVVQDVSDSSVFTDRNIRFDNNTYYGATHDAFAWGNRSISWNEWNAAGMDTNGVRLDGP
jgi:parallel beta-helix repeat protein